MTAYVFDGIIYDFFTVAHRKSYRSTIEKFFLRSGVYVASLAIYVPSLAMYVPSLATYIPRLGI